MSRFDTLSTVSPSLFLQSVPPAYTKMQADKVTYDDKGKIVDAHTTVIDPFEALRKEEEDHDIKFRTLSWQKTTLLLFGEYVCLAILALSWSWSVLGWVCGFFITFGLGAITWCKQYLISSKG